MTTAPDPNPPPARRVLVVEDTPEFAMVVQAALANEGYTVDLATTGSEGLDMARTLWPDVVILDLVLPDTGGLEVCRELRTFTDAYVVMLTSKDDEFDKVVGLSVGADDYMTKPFSSRELVARVAAMLRRPRTDGRSPEGEDGPNDDREVLQDGDLRVDVMAHEATVDGTALPLTRTEFDLLATLMARPSIVFTRAMLRDKVWGEDWFGDDHVVDVHIANLRKKVDRGRDASRIRTVRGVGYRFVG